MSPFWDDSQSCGNQSFCYNCHSQINPAPSLVYNYSYAYLFGGASTRYWWDIKKAFCAAGTCTSRHNLSSIENFIDNNAFGWGFPDEVNPCCACHNVHLSQRIGSPQTGNYDPSKSPIQRPSDHYNDPFELWGDDADERMSKYNYQAPFYGSPGNPISGPFEPANNQTSDGSNMPDYVTFCLDCHSQPIYSDTLNKIIPTIDWSSAGDKHGGRKCDPDPIRGPDCYGYAWGWIKRPYCKPSDPGYPYCEGENLEKNYILILHRLS